MCFGCKSPQSSAPGSHRLHAGLPQPRRGYLGIARFQAEQSEPGRINTPINGCEERRPHQEWPSLISQDVQAVPASRGALRGSGMGSSQGSREEMPQFPESGVLSIPVPGTRREDKTIPARRMRKGRKLPGGDGSWPDLGVRCSLFQG